MLGAEWVRCKDTRFVIVVAISKAYSAISLGHRALLFIHRLYYVYCISFFHAIISNTSHCNLRSDAVMTDHRHQDHSTLEFQPCYASYASWGTW